MTDLDALKRTVADLEKQVARIWTTCGSISEMMSRLHDADAAGSKRIRDLSERIKHVENKLRPAATYYGPAPKADEQWCRCGRDVCRYPACSSKVASVDDPDPLGR